MTDKKTTVSDLGILSTDLLLRMASLYLQKGQLEDLKETTEEIQRRNKTAGLV